MGVLLFRAGQAGGMHRRNLMQGPIWGSAARTWLELTGWKELGTKGPRVLTDTSWTWASSVPLAKKVNGTLDHAGMSVTAVQGRWSLPSALCWWNTPGVLGLVLRLPHLRVMDVLEQVQQKATVLRGLDHLSYWERLRVATLAWRREGSGGSYQCVYTRWWRVKRTGQTCS